jgi:hypothetical protein
MTDFKLDDMDEAVLRCYFFLPSARGLVASGPLSLGRCGDFGRAVLMRPR